jgi:nitroreductase
MNQTISLLCSHRSERSYTDEPVSDEALNVIVEAARRVPTSLDAQHISLVMVPDAARRVRIAEIGGGQPGSRKRRYSSLSFWIFTKPEWVSKRPVKPKCSTKASGLGCRLD